MHVYYIIFVCFCVILCLYSQFFRIRFVRYFSFQINCDFLSHVIYAIYLVKVMSVLLLAQNGTGLHGTNGLPPTTCIKLFNTYVLPRLLYGLETFILKPTHFNLLERFHLSFLRKIQCLPSRSVRGITYLLLGVRPITAEIHISNSNYYVTLSEMKM
jgi:hypothetical protein